MLKHRNGIIDFCLRCLAFLVPTPFVTRRLVDIWLKNAIVREKAFRLNEEAEPSFYRRFPSELPSEVIEKELAVYNFDAKQKSFILEWAQRAIFLYKPTD